jgi:hypothetical protein
VLRSFSVDEMVGGIKEEELVPEQNASGMEE